MTEPVVIEKRGGGMFMTIVWALFILVGWLVFAYLAFVFPGGLQAAWTWVRALPLLAQLVMWVLLLPWMLALWLWQLAWPAWIRLILVLGLAWVTYAMSVPPLVQLIRGK